MARERSAGDLAAEQPREPPSPLPHHERSEEVQLRKVGYEVFKA